MMAADNNSGAERHARQRLVDVQPPTGCFSAECNGEGDEYDMQLDRWANEGGAIGRQRNQLTVRTCLHRSTWAEARSAPQAGDRHLSVRFQQVG
jgi:hypothetical protein